jgi:hypothetical protein
MPATPADGGREIDLPVSDLVNPAYQTPTATHSSNGAALYRCPPTAVSRSCGAEQGPPDAAPALYAPAIPAFRAQRATLARPTPAALARRLERDVTVGYLDWLRARSSLEIVASSLGLLQENLRVNNSLYANGRITQDQVLRARAELLEVQQQLREATNLTSRSQQLVNFLLNRALDSPLEMASIESRDAAWMEAAQVGDDTELRSGALDRRPELRELEALEQAAGFQVEQERAARKPQVSIGVGIQARTTTSEAANFGIASVQLTVPVSTAAPFARGSMRRVPSPAGSGRRESARQIQLKSSYRWTGCMAATRWRQRRRAEAYRAGFRLRARRDPASSTGRFLVRRMRLAARS